MSNAYFLILIHIDNIPAQVDMPIRYDRYHLISCHASASTLLHAQLKVI